MFDYETVQGESCLTLQLPEEKSVEPHVLAVLRHVRIPGILPLSVRERNGRVWFSWGLRAMLPLTEALRRKKMTGEEITALVLGLAETLGACSDHLLPENRLVMQPAHIYTEPGTWRTHMVYLPLPETQPARQLFRELLLSLVVSHIQPADARADRVVAKLLGLVRAEGLTVQRIRETLETEENPRETIPRSTYIEEKDTSGEPAPVPHSLAGEMQAYSPRKEVQMDVPASAGFRGFLAAYPLRCRLADAVGFLALCAGVSAGLPGRLQVSLSGFVAAGVLLTGAAHVWLGQKKEKPEAVKKDTRRPAHPQPVRPATPVKAAPPPRVAEDAAPEIPAATRPEHTVLLAEGVRTCWLVSSGGERVLLPEGEQLLGKLEGEVDILLHSPAASRIHARIFRRGDACTVTDMNSTNGTFVNGRRLDSNVPAAIRQGDSVKFAGITYRFENG